LVVSLTYTASRTVTEISKFLNSKILK